MPTSVIVPLAVYVPVSPLTRVPDVSDEELLVSAGDVAEFDESILEGLGDTTENDIMAIINRFVDENPETAAHLLRNWFYEDGGGTGE